jgi:hypothetical protein
VVVVAGVVAAVEMVAGVTVMALVVAAGDLAEEEACNTFEQQQRTGWLVMMPRSHAVYCMQNDHIKRCTYLDLTVFVGLQR